MYLAKDLKRLPWIFLYLSMPPHWFPLFPLLNQCCSSQMEPKSLINHSTPPDYLNGNHPFGCEGALVSGQQRYCNSSRNKSKVRLNDQLIPKPTDINMGASHREKMIKFATPKEHPYSSHISQFAMFPSFNSPDDPETGVRAASQPFLNPLISNRAPDVTLLSKTKGSPYRHELLETPIQTMKKAVMWTGEHGFFDHKKPLKGENQVFYPTPPKTVLPNPKLRDWDLSISERTSNMLKNLERTHWITSYQMHYTGSGPVNPLKIDDFKEQISDLTVRNSHSAPLRERSFPVFVPSKAKGGHGRRHGSCIGRSISSPAAAELSNLFPAPNQGSALTTISQPRPQEITANHNEPPHPNHQSYSQSQEVLLKQFTENSGSSLYEGREREKGKVQFDESPMQASIALTDTERPPDLHDCLFSQGEMEVIPEKSLIEMCVKDEPSSQRDYLKAGRNAFSLSPPCILPRPTVLPVVRSLSRGGTVGSILDLQNSFSKSAAHHNFNSTITRAAVNLRENVVTGKKHDFYGINSYYLHG